MSKFEINGQTFSGYEEICELLGIENPPELKEVTKDMFTNICATLGIKKWELADLVTSWPKGNPEKRHASQKENKIIWLRSY
jgi:hypothetical protein